MLNNYYFFIGGWIPVFGEIDFNKINHGLIKGPIKRSKFYYDIKQDNISCIESITIMNSDGMKKYGEIHNIKISNDGYWQGKMVSYMHMDSGQTTSNDWFYYLLNDIGGIIRSQCDCHKFNKDAGNAGIKVTNKKIDKSTFDNNDFKDFKTGVLINILDEYNRKFDNYINDFLPTVERINYRKAFNFLTKAREDLLFYQSFLKLHSTSLKEYMKESDDCTEIARSFISIMSDKASFLNSEKVITKTNIIGYISLALGIISFIITIVLGWISIYQ